MAKQFGLGQSTIDQIRQVFSAHSEVESVVLYGSRAKGNYKVGSDIDFSMKGEGLEFSLLSSIADELDELPLPYQFDLSIFDNISSPDLVAHIKRVGVLFYKRREQN